MQGMSTTIQYTTIPDMRNRLGVEVQQLAYSMSVGSMGALFGGLFSILADRYSPFNPCKLGYDVCCICQAAAYCSDREYTTCMPVLWAGLRSRRI